MIASRKSLITMPAVKGALRLWVTEAMTCGPYGSGAVFCPSEASRDEYLEGADQMLPAHTRSRIFHGPVTYSIISNASLTIHVIEDIKDAAAVTDCWGFIVIHDPASWMDPRLLRYLTTRLAPRIKDRKTLIAVGSPLNLSAVKLDQFDDISTIKEIDYLAISKAVSQ